jgi:hypothetical protein
MAPVAMGPAGMGPGSVGPGSVGPVGMAPGTAGPGSAGPGAGGPGTAGPDGGGSGRADDDVWPRICEQFALRVLAAAYQMSSQLEAAEAEEQNPERLEKLYRIDHANTRLRRQAENLQVLAGHKVEDAGRQVTTLLDVVRAAASAIEHYPRIHIGFLADLAVVEFAADDVIRVLTELLDNAARFSPPTSNVLVSAHITELGSVLLRVEDAGVGLAPGRLASLNAMFEAERPAQLDGSPESHIGLLVVQRLALTHRIRVRLSGRQPGGTTATVLVPDGLVCEVPQLDGLPAVPSMGQAQPVPPQYERGSAYQGRAPVSEAHLVQPYQQPGDPPDESDRYASGAGLLATASGLPRRPRASLRGEPGGDGPAAGGFGGPAHGGFGSGGATNGSATNGSATNGSATNGSAAIGGAVNANPPNAQPADVDRMPWPDETADFAAGINDALSASGSEARSTSSSAFGGDALSASGSEARSTSSSALGGDALSASGSEAASGSGDQGFEGTGR